MGAGFVLVEVGLDHAAGEAGDLEGLVAAVLVGVAVHDPGLVELVHGAELGFAVDAEVEADLGVESGTGDEPLVFCVGDGDEQGTASAGDDDLGVDPEWHHDVLFFSIRAGEVEVAEVGEVAGVGYENLVAAGGDGGDEVLGGGGGAAGEGGLEGGYIIEAVQA